MVFGQDGRDGDWPVIVLRGGTPMTGRSLLHPVHPADPVNPPKKPLWRAARPQGDIGAAQGRSIFSVNSVSPWFIPKHHDAGFLLL